MSSSSSEVQLVDKSHPKRWTGGSLLPKHVALLPPPWPEAAVGAALPAPPSHQTPSTAFSGQFPDNSEAETALDGKLVPEGNVSAGWDNSTHHQISLGSHRDTTPGTAESSGWETRPASARQAIDRRSKAWPWFAP